ncbi:MAG: ATP-binding cassette domain-containing protein [Candidatus Longimicrobiales bacterium M2_2A_002]
MVTMGSVPSSGLRQSDRSADLTIRTRDLSRWYGRHSAVQDLSMDIPRGEIFGIVGPDGAGKTTLIQMLCGILTPSAGTASVLGFDTVREASRIAERVGYMSQEFSLYGGLTVAENIEFFADIHGVPRAARGERADRLLRFSRLSPFQDRLARNLSGGMKKKLALATMLIHDPDVLFLDEPTTGVDPLSRRDFWEIVFDFAGEGTTVVVATPYLDEAERCGRVALMHEGRLLDVDTPSGLKARLGGHMADIRTTHQLQALDVLRGDPDVRDAQVFGRSIHALLDSREAYRAVERRLRAAGIEVDTARCVEPGLEDVFVSILADGSSSPAMAAFPAVSETEHGAAIEVDGLTRRFGDFVAVDGVSFAVERGEVFGFLGPNGSGKSTTIRMLTGILPPDAGTARVAGIDIRRDVHRIRPILGYMSQRFSLYDDLTAEENLDFFAGAYGIPRREWTDRKAWALSLVGLTDGVKRRTGDLSGGWKQRLALAAAVLHRPRVLLLDEPTSGVDPLSRRQFWDVIYGFADAGMTVLVTTHYMDEAERCERIALLEGGRVRAVGRPDDLRQQVPGRMVEVTVADPFPALRAARDAPFVRQATLHGARLHALLEPGTDPESIRRVLNQAGLEAGAATPVPLSMEDVFIALVDNGNGRREHGS